MSILEKNGKPIAVVLTTASAITAGVSVYTAISSQKQNVKPVAKIASKAKTSAEVSDQYYIDESQDADIENSQPEGELADVNEAFVPDALNELTGSDTVPAAVLDNQAPAQPAAPLAGQTAAPAEPAAAPAVYEETVPVYEETVPVYEETLPVYEQTAGYGEEPAQPLYTDETAYGYQEAGYDESAQPVYDAAEGVYDETAEPVYEESTDPAQAVETAETVAAAAEETVQPVYEEAVQDAAQTLYLEDEAGLDEEPVYQAYAEEPVLAPIAEEAMPDPVAEEVAAPADPAVDAVLPADDGLLAADAGMAAMPDTGTDMYDQPMIDPSIDPTLGGTVAEVPNEQYAELNARIADEAIKLVGVTNGLQCTEVVQMAMANAGVVDAQTLWPREYADTYGHITEDPEPGNLIYYNQGGDGLDHIAIYIGNDEAVHGNYDIGDGTSQTVIAPAEVIGCDDYSFIQVER